MHGALAVLPQVDLIDIRIHEIGLGEAQLERNRHQGLAQLAASGLARVQEVAATSCWVRVLAPCAMPPAFIFAQMARAIALHRRHDAVEVAILHRFQRRGQNAGTSSGATTIRSSPCMGKTLPIRSGSRPDDRHWRATAVAQAGDAMGIRGDREPLRRYGFRRQSAPRATPHRGGLTCADTRPSDRLSVLRYCKRPAPLDFIAGSASPAYSSRGPAYTCAGSVQRRPSN